MLLYIAKFVCLVLAIAYGNVCVIGGLRGQGFKAMSNILFAIGLSGFIMLQWII